MVIEEFYYVILNVFLISALLSLLLLSLNAFFSRSRLIKYFSLRWSGNLAGLSQKRKSDLALENLPEGSAEKLEMQGDKALFLPENVQNLLACDFQIPGSTHMKRIIRSVMHHADSHAKSNLSQFWESWRSFFYKNLQMQKILLLEAEDREVLKVFRYVNFSIYVLFQLEEQINAPGNALRNILLQNRFLCFKGKLAESEYFSFLFRDFEYDVYGQLYVLPVVMQKEMLAVLLLFQKADQEMISKEQLRVILNDVLVAHAA